MKTFRISSVLKLKWMKTTWAIIGGLVIGALLGLLNKDLALRIAPIGDMYLSFLKMCVIPIMITAIVPSLGRLILTSGTSQYLKRMIVFFVVMLASVSALGLLAGWIGQPGSGLSSETRAVLGQVLVDSEVSGSGSGSGSTIGIAQFFLNMIPSNIFGAMVEGNSLQILFFSMIFGITAGFVPSANKSEMLFDVMEHIFKVFQKAIGWTLYVLPVGLLCIMAGQIARTGVEMMLAMGKFVLVIYGASIVMMLISALLISIRLRISYLQTWKDLRQTLIIAFGTRNSIATMPSILEVLLNKFHLEQRTVNLVIPLGIILCRFSMVLVFSLSLVFISQLYFIPLGFDGIVIALVGSVLAAVAGAGAPGVVSLSMLSMVAAPLGLPSSAAIILLIAINPIIDPIITTANVHLNCATAVWIANPTTMQHNPDFPVQESPQSAVHAV